MECTVCGAPVAEETATCPVCGHHVRANEHFEIHPVHHEQPVQKTSGLDQCTGEYKMAFRVIAGIAGAINLFSGLRTLFALSGVLAYGSGSFLLGMVLVVPANFLLGASYMMLAAQQSTAKNCMRLMAAGLAVVFVSNLLVTSILGAGGMGYAILQSAIGCIIPGIFWFCLSTGYACYEN